MGLTNRRGDAGDGVSRRSARRAAAAMERCPEPRAERARGRADAGAACADAVMDSRRQPRAPLWDFAGGAVRRSGDRPAGGRDAGRVDRSHRPQGFRAGPNRGFGAPGRRGRNARRHALWLWVCELRAGRPSPAPAELRRHPRGEWPRAGRLGPWRHRPRDLSLLEQQERGPRIRLLGDQRGGPANPLRRIGRAAGSRRRVGGSGGERGDGELLPQHTGDPERRLCPAAIRRLYRVPGGGWPAAQRRPARAGSAQRHRVGAQRPLSQELSADGSGGNRARGGILQRAK